MRSSKTLLTECFPEYIIDNQKLRDMQLRLLDVLVDIDYVCQKHNLQYFLSGGTLLGAVRHKGFIPWDDDIDIMMPIADYNQLGECVKQEFDNKYLVKYQRSDKIDATCCLKIYVKNTVYKEILSANWDKPQMLFVDVFAIRSAPNSKLKQKIKGKIFDIALHGAGLKAEYKFPSKVILEKAKDNVELKKYMNKRRFLSRIANMLPMSWWFALANRMLKKSYPNSNLTNIPEGIRYSRELLPSSVYESSVDVEFEGKMFKAPIEWEKYLKNLYGDYMQLPPEDKRERHLAIEIKF